MLLRIDALHASLAIILLSLTTRTHMQLLHETSGFYCPCCTPRHSRGLCGPTCPLLRPYSSSSPFYGAADKAWVRQLVADRGKYREITADMAARGTAVYASTVAKWERAVAKLMDGAEAPTERWEREGWPPCRVVHGKRMVVFKSGWSFERAWGRDGVLDVEVPPEVGSGRVAKRKFVEYGGDDDIGVRGDCGKRFKCM
jgi:hypothetical protein